MSPVQILDQLLKQDLPRSIEIFAPELVLCATIVLMLLVRMLDSHRRIPMQLVALVGATLVFLGVFTQFVILRGNAEPALLEPLFRLWSVTPSGVGTPGTYFTGLLTHDLFAVFLRLGLSLFLVLLIALTILSGVPDRDDAQDFYALIFGATLGMMMAVGANNLLILFLAVEMMSLPSYLVVAFQKGKRKASEASLKYVVYGAGAAGVMLYGISLIAGLLGTVDLSLLSQRAMLVLEPNGLAQNSATALCLMLGILMVLAGLAFKLALVPFHFWCPDAFEGALSEVGAFLSVAAKIASFGMLIRFVLAFHGNAQVLHEICLFIGVALGIAGIISTTYGNLAAYQQNNLKRLLAYSTIAQSGYTVMAVSAMLVLLSAQTGTLPDATEPAARCVEGMLYYLIIYLFMNLSAFGCVALLRNDLFSEEIESYQGLFNSRVPIKIACLCLAITFFSLIGLPPLGGFFGKFMIFSSLYAAGHLHWFLWVVLAVGALNTVLSVFYYVRVLKAIFLKEQVRRPMRSELQGSSATYLALVTFPIIALGATPMMADLSEATRQIALLLLR